MDRRVAIFPEGGEENHAYFHESRERKIKGKRTIKLLKHIALYSLPSALTFSKIFSLAGTRTPESYAYEITSLSW